MLRRVSTPVGLCARGGEDGGRMGRVGGEGDPVTTNVGNNVGRISCDATR